jgi:hypothetical protein
MRRLRNLLASAALGVAAALAPACVTTPLPIPPTVDPDLITITPDAAGVIITGSEGAVDPGGVDVRVSYRDPDIDSVPILTATAATGDDGSFEVAIGGAPTDLYYIEILLADEDLFAVAITAGDDAGGAAVEADPGPDADSDGSPDEIDCAPLDETLGGQRCP